MALNYINDKMIGAGEEVKVECKISPLIYVFLLGLGVITLLTVIIPLICLYLIIKILFFEYAVTNKKIAKKTGIIAVNTDELKNSKVESVNIKQGIIGRIFGFGSLVFTGTGNQIIEMEYVANPSAVKREIEDLIFEKTE